jgi:hypothetical protein
MFTTLDLVDACVVSLKSRQFPTISRHSGTLLCFDFLDLTEQTAESYLRSADAELCRKFHATLRNLRREMDSLTRAENGRGARR